MSNQIDVTEKFEKALIGFSCDFSLAEMGVNHLAELDEILKREDTDKHKQRLVKDIELLKNIDWSDIKYNTAGNPSISKSELIKVYMTIKNII